MMWIVWIGVGIIIGVVFDEFFTRTVWPPLRDWWKNKGPYSG